MKVDRGGLAYSLPLSELPALSTVFAQWQRWARSNGLGPPPFLLARFRDVEQTAAMMRPTSEGNAATCDASDPGRGAEVPGSMMGGVLHSLSVRATAARAGVTVRRVRQLAGRQLPGRLVDGR